MSAKRLAVIAAAAAALVWAAKAVAIGLAGGLDKSPAEGPLFFLGLLCFVVAGCAFGAALTTGRPVAVRVLGVIAVAVVVLLLSQIVGAVVATFAPPENEAHWVWAEVELWIGALVLLGATAAFARRGAMSSEAAVGR
ncbi:MAG TPA: hypothetical protein VFQ19_16410 [Nocardioidaceae bacterium]|nr:hypothetical protein [Nocardioidaceae bacterium]